MRVLSVLLLLLIILLVASSVSSEQIGWWKLDEGTGFTAYDSSGYGHDGSIGSGQSWNAQGSLDFVGGTLPNTENSITFSSADANGIFESVDSKMMVSFWVKLYEPFELSRAYYCTRGGDIVSFVEFRPDFGPGGILTYKPNPETVCYVVDIFNPNSENYIDMSLWNHFLFVRDLENDTIEIYLNGSLLNTKISDTPPCTTLAGIDDFIIGGFADTGYFKGSIKDFRIYNDSDICCIDIDVQPDASGPYIIRSGQELTFDGDNCFTDGLYGYGTSWYVDDYFVGQGGGMCSQDNCFESQKVSVTFDELVDAVGYGKHEVRLDMVSYNENMQCNCEKSDTTTIIVVDPAADADFQHDGNVNFADFAIFASAWQNSNAEFELHLKLDETTGTTLADESPNNNHGISAKEVDLMKPLVAHWKMNDSGTTATDSSGNFNDGIAANDIVSVAGKINSAISFNGTSDYIDCGSSIEETNHFSVGVWINAGTLKTAGVIANRIDGGTAGYRLLIGSDGTVYVQASSSSTVTVTSGATKISAGSWYHLMFTYHSSGNLSLYINGSLVGSGASVGSMGVPVANTFIGCLPQTLVARKNYFDGILDDVRIYSKALSESELDDIYMNGLGTEAEVWNKGAIDNTLFFNGVDDYVGCGADSSIANIFDGGGTLTCWVNVEDAGINGNGTVADKDGGWRLFVNGNNTTMCFSSVFSENPGSWQFSIPSTGWVHIAIAYDDDSIDNDPVVYVNGTEVSITEIASPIGNKVDDSSEILYIGNNKYYANASSRQPFYGYLDDLRLYSEALTAEQMCYPPFSSSCDISEPADGKIDSKDLSTFVDFWLIGN